MTMTLQRGFWTPSGTASSLLTGLVSYWKLDEASGTRADSHGSNTLTDNNTVTSAAGKLNDAAQFTAANSEYLSVADNASLSMTAAMSLSCWVYLDTDTRQTIASKWTYSTDGGWSFEYTVSGTWAMWIADSPTDGGSNRGSVNAGASTATWYHLVWVFDGGGGDNAARLKLYINASAQTLTFIGTIPASLQDNAGALLLGLWNGFGNYMNGRIDEVGIWSKALTSDEVTTLYGAGTPPAYPF